MAITERPYVPSIGTIVAIMNSESRVHFFMRQRMVFRVHSYVRQQGAGHEEDIQAVGIMFAAYGR